MNTDDTAVPPSAPHDTPLRPRSRALTWLVRFLAAAVVLVIGLAACGLVYQAVGEANDARMFPPPGQMVNVNGLNMHLDCVGEGAPTVLLEAMAGNNSTEWGWIQPEIAKTNRVCAYDRVGAGWSDSPTDARTAEETVQDLHALLQTANIAPPYVLVGHSIGGIFSRMYTAEHPDEVAGVVLVDSAHPEQIKRFPEMRSELENYAQDASVYPLAARLGLFRLFFASGGELDFSDLAPQQQAELKAMWSAPKYHSSTVQSIPATLAMYDRPPMPGTLGDRPLIVVSATANPSVKWMDIQKELATLSTDASHRLVQGASHASLAFHPEHAEKVTEAIQDVVAAVRAEAK